MTHVLTLEEKKTHFGFCLFFPSVKPDSTITLLVRRAKFSSMAYVFVLCYCYDVKEFVVSLFVVVVVVAVSVAVRPAASPRNN